MIFSNGKVAMIGFSLPLASPSSTYCFPFAIRSGLPTTSNSVLPRKVSPFLSAVNSGNGVAEWASAP